MNAVPTGRAPRRDADISHLPTPLTLGLGADGITPEMVRDRLAALGRDDPEVGHGVADQLALTALQLIADGYPHPQVLARDTLTVVSAHFPRWAG